jgi:hypothetical protein
MSLLDVSRDGRVLLAHGFVRVGVMAVAPDETVERDVSAFDRSQLAGLSADGRRELWKKVGPSDPAGVTFVATGRISDDARSYAYSYARHLLDLFVVDGLK